MESVLATISTEFTVLRVVKNPTMSPSDPLSELSPFSSPLFDNPPRRRSPANNTQPLRTPRYNHGLSRSLDFHQPSRQRGHVRDVSPTFAIHTEDFLGRYNRSSSPSSSERNSNANKQSVRNPLLKHKLRAKLSLSKTRTDLLPLIATKIINVLFDGMSLKLIQFFLANCSEPELIQINKAITLVNAENAKNDKSAEPPSDVRYL